MPRKRLTTKADPPHTDDLAFLPPYSEQAKYLALANQFLSRDYHRNVISIDSSKQFRRPKKDKKVA
jgi:hypothetical protein